MDVGFTEKEIKTSLGLDGVIRTLESELTYYSELLGKQVILVPVGTRTDYGSIPRLIQVFIPKDGKATFAYILHDYLYQMGMFSRGESDDMLEEAMQSLNVSWFKRKAVRSGLKIGGWVAWNKHRKNKGGK